MRKLIAYMLVRIAFKIMPESKAVKEFAQYLATSAMIDGGYVTITNPADTLKEAPVGEDELPKDE